MRLEQLRYLIQIHKDKSMNKASQNLNISVQALSLSLNSIENELGISVFTRSHKGMQVTAAGREILRFSEHTLKEYDSLLTKIGQKSPETPVPPVSGTISLYANPMFMEIGLTKTITEFRKLYPDIRINLAQTDVSDMLSAIIQHKNSRRGACLGLVVLPGTSPQEHELFLKKQNPELIIKPFSSKRFFCAVSFDSVYAKYNSISFSTIIKAPLVVFSNIGGNYNCAVHILKKYGNPNVVTTAGSITAWHQALKDNIGVGLLNSSFVDEDSPTRQLFQDIKLIPIRDSCETVNAFIVKKTVMPLEQTFISFIRENHLF